MEEVLLNTVRLIEMSLQRHLASDVTTISGMRTWATMRTRKKDPNSEIDLRVEYGLARASI